MSLCEGKRYLSGWCKWKPMRNLCDLKLQQKKKESGETIPQLYKANLKSIPGYNLCDLKLRSKKKESGETIPQLYKANVKSIPGYNPERFTFRAVTGTCPIKTSQCECKLKLFPRANQKDKKPHICSQKCKIHSSQGFYPCCQRYASNLPGKYKKSQKECEKIALARRAFMNLHGSEYISTQSLPERIDIYCFDHLNTSYFRTSDNPPSLITDIAIERMEVIATRFWAEIFGFAHFFIAFVTAFILQLYKFILYSIIRPLMIGLTQLTADYFIKPLLTILYNGYIQPFLVFLFNVAASLRDLCSPIARGLGYFVSEAANLLRSIRLIEYIKTPVVLPIKKDAAC